MVSQVFKASKDWFVGEHQNQKPEIFRWNIGFSRIFLYIFPWTTPFNVDPHPTNSWHQVTHLRHAQIQGPHCQAREVELGEAGAASGAATKHNTWGKQRKNDDHDDRDDFTPEKE